MDAFTAQQTIELVSRIGCKKATTRLDKLFFNAFMSGPLLGFGCAVLLSTESAEWYQENAPGLIRTFGALLFPIGLVMIVLTGADLFTSNIMFMTTAFLHRRVGVLDVAKNWVVVFFGNLAGSLFFMAIITGYGGVFSTGAYKIETINFATQKVVQPMWHQIMLKGIGANWLVCMAVYLSISARELVSKIVAIWWPTATFVALGLDHVVANMFFIPMAIFVGHPQITVGYYIWKSLIPTTIGNMIGGAIFVALPYWYLYLTGEGSVEIDFNLGSLDTAEGVGGPMRRSAKGNDGTPLKDGDHSSNLLQGREIDHEHVASDIPHSPGHMKSAISKELDGEKYGRPKAEVDKEKEASSDEGAQV